MTTRRVLFLASALVAVTGAILLLAAPTHARGESPGTVVEGTGRWSSQVARSTEVLDPSCVSLVRRVGHVAFTGFITSALGDGTMQSEALRDVCMTSAQGPVRQTYDLLNATVAGRTGHLRIVAVGPFDGDSTTPPGARIQYQLRIRGIGGDLDGAEGEGLAVGFETAFPGESAGSSVTYFIRLRFGR